MNCCLIITFQYIAYKIVGRVEKFVYVLLFLVILFRAVCSTAFVRQLKVLLPLLFHLL